MAKKGKNIREQRLRSQEERKMKYRAQEAERQAEIVRLQEAEIAREKEEKRKEAEKTRHPVTRRMLSSDNKSNCKAAGLKSTLIINENELLMTVFGRGNQALPEKHIIGKNISTIPEKATLTVNNENDVYFDVTGRGQGAVADNPLYKFSQKKEWDRQDRISREKLEMRYYGQTFEDNIHIQLIYNILDIEKILSIHINNIVYTINNLLRREDMELFDLLAYITDFKKYKDIIKEEDNLKKQYYKELFEDLCKAPQLAYFNMQVIDDNKKKADPNAILLTKEELYGILYTLGKMRHMLMHGNPKENIYKIDSQKDKSFKNGLDCLNRLYGERVRKLNDNFLNLAKKNLLILFEAFEVKTQEEKENYVRDYYDFVVRKQFKNQGFSIKCLREHMTDDIEEAAVLRDQKYDSVRGKLYPLVNFAIFRYYNFHGSEADDLVENLRAAMNEVEKDKIYQKEAVRIWPEMRKVILKHILPEMEGSRIKAKNKSQDPDVSFSMIDPVIISTDATLFTKIIFLTTLFINGKETNDLITTLISKFENITAFNDILKQQGMVSDFVKNFEFFNHCDLVSEELRVVNSFVHMKRENVNAKKIMYDEALTVLGIDDEKKNLELEQMLDRDIRQKNAQRAGLRNFIANNVIESERFKYLVRYGNVQRLKGIANNQAVMKFVLNDIPDEQIARYYKSITGYTEDSVQKMRAHLVEMLTGFSFENISDVRQNDKLANQKEQEDKRQKQALVRLYLTAIYLVLKNLVYVNSRYSLAFKILERDYVLEKGMDQNKVYGNPTEFAEDLLKEHPYKKRVQEYVLLNIANSDPWAIKAFRNKIEHLDAVRFADIYLRDVKNFNSWFELYHYIVQRRIMDQYAYDSRPGSSKQVPGTSIIDEKRLNPATVKYFHMIEMHRTCCKDFIKALNTPFAYNLARYKNLTIDALFDKNRRQEVLSN